MAMHELSMEGFIGLAMPPLLYAYWILATGAAVVSLLPCAKTTTFRAAVVLSSCRGKTWDKKPQIRLGPLTHLSVPQSWFAHFYAVGAITNLTVLAIFSGTLGQKRGLSPDIAQLKALTALALTLLQLHLSRRLIESLLVFHYPRNARMHVIAYLFGMSYYIVLPLSLLPSGFWRRVAKYMLHLSSTDVQLQLSRLWPLIWEGATGVWLGVGVFLAGNLLQLQAHWILGSLRHVRPRNDAAGPYSIPKGGAFELVSCPHYLAEIIIYLGLLMVLGRHNVLIWLVFTWVVANLLLAAMPTHRWYLQHFSAYPKDRRALIPYIY